MKRKKNNNRVSRFTALIILMFIIYAAILIKLVNIQVINYEKYKKRADSSSTRTISQAAPRGKIIDSNGVILADSKNTYSIVYLETDDSSKEIFNTLGDLFPLMDSLGVDINDDFPLKIDDSGKFYMDYDAEDKSSYKPLDLRWKKDRGLDYYLKKEDSRLSDLKDDEYTEEDLIYLEDKILEVTPEEMFYRLVKQYSLYKLLEPTEDQVKAMSEMTGKEITKLLEEKYSLQEIRKYMLVLDEIKMSSYSSYDSVIIASNISDENANILMQKENLLSGINIKREAVRYYPYDTLGSTVMGYMTSISASNQEKYEKLGYDVSSDKVGGSGIESAFEKYLAGEKSKTIVNINTYGKITEELYSTDAVPGNDVVLNVDAKLQATAEKALEQTLKELQRNKYTGNGNITANATRGAVVVQEVKTGKVRAMASYPFFNSNDIDDEILSPDYEAFVKDYINKTGTSLTAEQLFPDNYTTDKYDIYPKALYNYATQGPIPTGSTFKFVTAMAALEEGVVDPSEQILDQGIFNKHSEVSNYTGVCGIYESYGSTHGYENMTTGFRDSCNYYFYELAYRLYKKDSIDTLAEYAWKLGLGYNPETDKKSSTGIEIEESTGGQVYSSTAYTNLVSSLSKYDLVNMLESGTYTYAPSLGYSHKSFNIGINKNDSEELAAAKQAVKDYVSDSLKALWDVKNNNAFYNEMYNTTVNLLKNLVENYPEEERKGYKESDYENAASNVARYVVFDMSGDVTSVGNMLNSSIGLGMNNFTPLQLASALCTVLNGGTRYQSYLVDKIVDSDGNIVEDYSADVLEELNLKPTTVNAIKEGMAAVTASNSSFYGFPIKTGGKTGTAIYSNSQKAIGRSSYAVFECFAPYDDPEIVVTVVLYDGGSGGNAAPVARAVMETYFRDEILQSNPGYKSTTSAFSLKPEL